MIRRILSIDFDYFLDTDLDTRNLKFPDGEDGMTDDKLVELWNYFYNKYPEIADIGVIKPFFNFCEDLSKLKRGAVYFAESHREIARFFPVIESEEHLEVVNIDFHHDNYAGGSQLDCSNWVRHLKEFKPNAHIKWIRREDSETASLFGDFPYEHTEDLTIDGEFDYIFICFSPEWTPPHLRIYYKALLTYVSHLITLS